MVRANKRLGQHFLRDLTVVDKAVSSLELTGRERVLEIGPGQGVLTRALAEEAAEVIAIELDPGMVATLQATMPDNVVIHHMDVLKADLEALGPFDRVAGNLPYQISSPLTFKVLDVPFDRAVFLYQLEFAQRLVADVEDDHYGRLSVTRAYRAEAQIIRRVKRGAFLPPPKVLSALVELVPHAAPPFDIGPDLGFFDAVVRELFGQRRKTLRKALSNQAPVLGLGKMGTERAQSLLDAADVEVERAEQLAPAGFGRIAKILADHRVDAVGPADRTDGADAVDPSDSEA